MKLTYDFYNREAHLVAKDLLGKLLVRATPEGTVKGRIVEVEVYKGTADSGDRACHAYPMKRTARTEVMFGEAAHAYIYLIYGMYSCLNLVCNEAEVPECVLIRALEPVEGLELMQERRKQKKPYALCSGPGKLCQALALTRAENGMSLCGDELYVETDGAEEGLSDATWGNAADVVSESLSDAAWESAADGAGIKGKIAKCMEKRTAPDGFTIVASKRINIDYAGEAKDFLWRYTIAGHPYLSIKEKKPTTM